MTLHTFWYLVQLYSYNIAQVRHTSMGLTALLQAYLSATFAELTISVIMPLDNLWSTNNWCAVLNLAGKRGTNEISIPVKCVYISIYVSTYLYMQWRKKDIEIHPSTQTSVFWFPFRFSEQLSHWSSGIGAQDSVHIYSLNLNKHSIFAENISILILQS